MTFSQLRRLVDSLMLKYADELEVYRLRPIAQQFCDDMTSAVTGSKRGRPRSIQEWGNIFFQRTQERGLRIMGRVHLDSYLNQCLDRRVLPQVNEVLCALLPKAVRRGLIPRSIQEPVPF